jgi:hypothetical protein
MTSHFKILSAAVLCGVALTSTSAFAATPNSPNGAAQHDHGEAPNPASRPAVTNPAAAVRNAMVAAKNKIPPEWRKTVAYGVPTVMANGAAAVAFASGDHHLAVQILSGTGYVDTATVVSIPAVNRRYAAGVGFVADKVSRWTHDGRPKPPDLLTERETVAVGDRTYRLSLTTHSKRTLSVSLFPDADTHPVEGSEVDRVLQPKLAKWYADGFNTVTVRSWTGPGKLAEKTFDLKKLHKDGALTSDPPESTPHK